MTLLLTAAALTALIHFINTLALSVRVSGVRTHRLATAASLYNVVFLLASTANSVLAPLMAAINERVINSGSAPGAALLSVGQLGGLEGQGRIILGAATVGTVIGALCIPAFVVFFTRAIGLFEETGSVPRLIGRLLLSPRVTSGLPPLPGGETSGSPPAKSLPIPKTFLILNALVAGLYTTGVLSAVFAGALNPETRQTAITLSPLINGFATVLLAAVVDPTAASITDQAMNGERDGEDVKRMAFYLSGSRIAGTVLAQALFLPAAYVVKNAAIILCR